MEIYDHYISHLQEFSEEQFSRELFESLKFKPHEIEHVDSDTHWNNYTHCEIPYDL
jgi:hypothetical protein